jgi:hypothetical protein
MNAFVHLTGRHHRSGRPNHLSFYRLEASCDEIASVG